MNMSIPSDDPCSETRTILSLVGLGMIKAEEESHRDQGDKDISTAIDHHSQLKQSMCHLPRLQSFAHSPANGKLASRDFHLKLCISTNYEIVSHSNALSRCNKTIQV